MSAATPTFDIPGYRIVRPLGEGGMATVYLALQTALGRQVAIKVLAVQRAPSEELVRRFEQETRLIARLDHPHIVSIYEVGRTSTGQLYYTMPYLPNGDLAARDLREDQTGIVAVMRALCQALAYAHDQGIVHRDVKPENVLFDKLDRPLLADFGIALATHSDVRVTREGATLGSTGYMSPEQARGLAIDGRSDLYSLGVLCYELVAGELPFQGPDALAVALAHVENPVPRLSPTRRHWQALIDRALAKDPAERFQSAAELLEALDAVQAHLNGQAPSGAGAPAPRRQRWAWSRSHWLAAGAAGLLLVGAGQLLRGPAAERAGGEPATGATPAGNAAAGRADDAVPPGAAERLLDTATLDRLLAEGGALLKQGKLVEPAGDNAAERYLAVLKPYPDQSEALAGLQGVLDALGARLEKSLQRDDAAAARADIEQVRLLLDRAPAQHGALWSSFASRAADALNRNLQRAARRFDATALEGLRAPMDALGAEGAELRRRLDALLRTPLPTAGAAMRDAAGPPLVFVPADRGAPALDHAFALATTEVTRAEYAAFARASGRAAASCRVPHQPLSRLKKLAWQDPDFAQTDADPVVCVSWQDARAYTRWLSQRTGASYRLPTQVEWLAAARGISAADACRGANVADASKGSLLGLGDRYKCSDGYAYTAPVGHFRAGALGIADLFGNVSEWTLDCSSGAPLEALLKDSACPERVFRGTSWRDGPAEPPLEHRGASDPDVGYTTVGFRVLREVALDDLPGSE